MHWIDKVHPLSLEILGEEDIMTITPYLDQTKKRMMILRVRIFIELFTKNSKSNGFVARRMTGFSEI